MNWSHPLAVAVGVAIGLLIREYLFAHRPPTKHDVTIRFKEDDDACNPHREPPDAE